MYVSIIKTIVGPIFGTYNTNTEGLLTRKLCKTIAETNTYSGKTFSH